LTCSTSAHDKPKTRCTKKKKKKKKTKKKKVKTQNENPEKRVSRMLSRRFLGGLFLALAARGALAVDFARDMPSDPAGAAARAAATSPRAVSLALSRAARTLPEDVGQTNALCGPLWLLLALDVSSAVPGATPEAQVTHAHGLGTRLGLVE
jgi:hypothetical protein